MAKRKKAVYMKVTRDKYELPVAIANTMKELAQILGVKKDTISGCISRYNRGIASHSAYRKVEIDDDE